jgi:hypothetical protein
MQTRLKKETGRSEDESKYTIHYSQGETPWETLSIHKNSKPNKDQYTNLDPTVETHLIKQDNEVMNLQQLSYGAQNHEIA